MSEAKLSSPAGSPLTHTQLVRRIARWLQVGGRSGYWGSAVGYCPSCKVVFAEFHTMTTETPDVIGWYGGNGSVLIECKISRADFHADKAKSFRKFEEMGMGDYRFFAAPEGVLRPEDVPEGWGLIEVAKHVHQRKPCVPKRGNKANEVTMLISAIRRLQLSTAVFVQTEENTEVAGGSPAQ